MHRFQNFNKILIVLLCFHFVLVYTFSAQAQKCAKKKLADKEIREDFDYRGQSLFIELGNGDSTTLNIVLYSKQNYRIFVVGEQKLGKIDYEIIVPRKKFNRVVQDIQQKKVTAYKKDPNGFYLYNTEGERIPIGEVMVNDTIWSRETNTTEELVFNSKEAESTYWTATPSKTQMISIKVYVEKTDKAQRGCIGVYVGREFSNAYQFRR